MAREQWAKVDVDMPTDEKLFGRPLLERHLWTCLVCLSKKNWIETGDYTIHNLGAAALNSRFNLGSTPGVEKGLKYFETCEPRPMIKRRDGSIFLLNIEKRQANHKTGEPSPWPEQRAQRERTNLVYFIQSGATGLIKVGTSKNPWARMATLQREHPELGKLTLVGTLPGSGYDVEFEIHTKFKEHRRTGEWFEPHPALIAIATSQVAPATVAATSQAVASKLRRPATGEATGLQQDEDEDLDQDEDQIAKQIADPAARAPVPWPPGLLEQLRVALRRQLETNDREWANFVRDTSAQFPLDRRIRAAQAFLQRMKPGQSYRPAYVFAMIRDGAEPTKGESNGPASTDGPEDHHAATQRMLAARKANADQAIREREEAKAKGVPSAATKALDKVLGRRPNGSPRT